MNPQGWKVFLLAFGLSGLLGRTVQAGEVIRVGTASNSVIAVVVETGPGEADPSQDPSLWTVNGQAPLRVGRMSAPWYEGTAADNYPITMRHHIYLQLSSSFVKNRTYRIQTPYGPTNLTFNSRHTLCESIHVNQVGYSQDSTVRYANIGIFLGDLGPQKLGSDPVNFVVRNQRTRRRAIAGTVTFWGDDTGTTKASGEYVYRIDLSRLPKGGPYYIVVKGFGRSYPFGVGGKYSNYLNYVHTRGLYHQRCGIALEEPYTDFVRGACHTTVEVTDAEPPGFIHEEGPVRPLRGGYHDAGDFDHRFSHVLIPAWMLNLYDAFPQKFRDGDYDIPESGNGIPDWLDEALWGVLLWENLQENDGGVRAGSETNAHPAYGIVNAATDPLIYRTFRRDGSTTAVSAGLFAQASRLVRPFDPEHADVLAGRAVRAWNWVVNNNPPSAHAAQRMYGSLQLYLLTGEQKYHQAFLANADYILNQAGWPEQYFPPFFNLNTIEDGMVFSPYFTGYLFTDRPTDKTVRDELLNMLSEKAARTLSSLAGQPYPLGPAGTIAWGAATAQGKYADPAIYMYRVTGDQVYLDAASQLADYSLGLNPLGKVYVTGLGQNPPNNPLQLDTFFTEQAGLGRVPGIVVYGPFANPSSISYQKLVWERVFPRWQSLPEQRRYSEGWSLIPVNEFTTWETLAPNACMYAFLADGAAQSANSASSRHRRKHGRNGNRGR